MIRQELLQDLERLIAEKGGKLTVGYTARSLALRAYGWTGVFATIRGTRASHRRQGGPDQTRNGDHEWIRSELSSLQEPPAPGAFVIVYAQGSWRRAVVVRIMKSGRVVTVRGSHNRGTCYITKAEVSQLRLPRPSSAV